MLITFSSKLNGIVSAFHLRDYINFITFLQPIKTLTYTFIGRSKGWIVFEGGSC